MSDNKQGMSYREAERRISGIVKNPGNQQAKVNLANSIVNQVRVREGQGAANELRRQFSR